jgi:hypothetical protein
MRYGWDRQLARRYLDPAARERAIRALADAWARDWTRTRC